MLIRQATASDFQEETNASTYNEARSSHKEAQKKKVPLQSDNVHTLTLSCFFLVSSLIHPVSCSFMQFHPISSCLILSHPVLSSFCFFLFNPLSVSSCLIPFLFHLVSYCFILFHPVSSFFHQKKKVLLQSDNVHITINTQKA